MKILRCYGDGNPNFDAFNARLDCGETIEKLYQSAKRDANGNPYQKGKEKGKTAHFMNICGQNIPCSGEHERIRYTWYTMLWQVWFFENPERYAEACEYEGFVDKYDRMGGKLYKPGDDYQAEKGCTQSASIAYLVGSDNELPHNPEIIAQSFTKYWTKHHPEIPIAENWQASDEQLRARAALDQLLEADPRAIAAIAPGKLTALLAILREAIEE